MKKGIIAMAAIAFVLFAAFFIIKNGFQPVLKLKISVIGEDGRIIDNAKAEGNTKVFAADSSGVINIKFKQGPELLMVSAPGYLVEPVLVGWEDMGSTLQVQLLNDAGGKRMVLNFGGDVMFGRRYLDGSNEISQKIRDGEGENFVVKNLARAFSAADMSCANFESIIGSYDKDEAYASKRYLIESRPESAKAMQLLGLELVSIANNHILDWYDQGLENTIDILTKAGIKFVGAGNLKTAREPVVMGIRGTQVGTLAYTLVTGDRVNDFLPRNDAVMPKKVKKDDYWQWEKRTWSWNSNDWQVPLGQYRIGEIWHLYSLAKPKLSMASQTAIWEALKKTYPELLNYIVTPGQLGAAEWDDQKSIVEIEALRQKADVVIVQLHAGFQNTTSPSARLVKAARLAVDAGADIVVSHHPHVLQGMEWYKGHLIVYSLGNLVFDQDFLDTFASAYLKTVWEGSKLVEARLIPLEIVDYRPTLVTGVSARRIISQVWESSQQALETISLGDQFYTQRIAANPVAKPVNFGFEWGTGRLMDRTVQEKNNFELAKGEVRELENDQLWPARLGLGNDNPKGQVYIGRDLFGWGHMEDTLADGESGGSTHVKKVGQANQKWQLKSMGGKANGYLQLSRNYRNKSMTMLRTGARIPLVRHRLYDADHTPLDPEPFYTVRLKVRGKGRISAGIRVDSYWFYDENPASAPVSELLGQNNYELQVTSGADWQYVEIPINLVQVDGKYANALMLYVQLNPPPQNKSLLEIDDVALIEWRDASIMPDMYGVYTHIKNVGSPVQLQFSTLGSDSK